MGKLSWYTVFAWRENCGRSVPVLDEHIKEHESHTCDCQMNARKWKSWQHSSGVSKNYKYKVQGHLQVQIKFISKAFRHTWLNDAHTGDDKNLKPHCIFLLDNAKLDTLSMGWFWWWVTYNCSTRGFRLSGLHAALPAALQGDLALGRRGAPGRRQGKGAGQLPGVVLLPLLPVEGEVLALNLLRRFTLHRG